MVDSANFDQLRIGLASPEEIHKWSKGEVRKPETINYRTFKPEPDGLFCEKIFGPTRDWECHCGKYRKIKFRGITCDRCGVEVTRSKVRRERMGHIELAAPASHIWYLKGVPSPMSLLLDISPRSLERVVYFASYVVTGVEYQRLVEGAKEMVAAVDEEKEEIDRLKEEAVEELKEQAQAPSEEASDIHHSEQAALDKQTQEAIKHEEKSAEERKADLDSGLRLLLGSKLDGQAGLTKKQLITETDYRNLERVMEILEARYGQKYQNLFRAGLGAEATKELLAEIDLEDLCRTLRQDIKETSGPKRARAVKRLEVAESFRKSKNRPEWMIMEAVPVLPPELRPMVQLDGGRFATSDLNDLYRRIINRNNRLKKIRGLNAPESIINHEKRLLQEAVDALIDNGRRSRPVTGSDNRPLKSLSDMLKGKEGRFRKNLLGKRVDYSGRSVIVVGPHLKLHQCGLPKEMALELFKPFVMKRLVEKGYTTNIKTAKKMVDRAREEVWDALEEVVKDHPVLLNRAPTLHRLGIQAFEPVLVDSKAIQIHPLVCASFNADFDGDTMSVHVPLSTAAETECKVLMLSTENLFSPAHGKPLVTPTRDMILGCYYLTQKRKEAKGDRKQFANPEEAILAYHAGLLDLHADIEARVDGALVDTTVGRVIFNQCLPAKLRYLDRVIDDHELGRVIADCHREYGTPRTVQLLDDLKDLGFRFATVSGVTISMTDMDVPEARTEEVIGRTEQEVIKNNELYQRGLITSGERQQRVCDLWTEASEEVSRSIVANIDRFNPIFMMAKSGARSTLRQISQLSGMRGLMTDPFGRFVEDLPIKSNFHQGLSILEYFVSTHGARKGLADTALRTADAGYLTRRLVDVAQDVIIKEHDCGTTAGIWISALREEAEEIEPLENRIEGRVAWLDIVDPRTDEIILRAGQEMGSGVVSPCSKCSAELESFQVCSACGRERIQPETKAEKKEEEEPGMAVDSWDLGRCSECGSEVNIAWRCPSCQADYAESDLEPPMARIKWVVQECENFVAQASSVTAGKTASATITDPFTGKAVVTEGKVVSRTAAQKLAKLVEKLTEKGGLAVGRVPVRSPLTCDLRLGICALCYGRDLAANRLVEIGEAVGIIAAQSIGEPGTQVTLRTFHTGGVAAQYLTGVAEVKKRRQRTLRELHDDIQQGIVAFEGKREGKEREWVQQIQRMLKVLEQPVTGLLRVVELFEARRPKGQAIVCEVDGVVSDIDTTGVKTVIIDSEQSLEEVEQIVGEVTAQPVTAPRSKQVLVQKGRELTPELMAKLRQAKVKSVKIRKSYLVPYRGYLKVDKGDRIEQGDPLTGGPLDPQKVLVMKGLRGVQDYLASEIQKVYRSQGVDINNKHLEIIVRQMLKKRRIIDPGDTDLLPGQVVGRFQLEEANRQVREKGGEEASI